MKEEINELKQNKDKEDTEDCKKKHRKRNRKKPVLITLVLLLFVAIGATYTWYLFRRDNQGDRENIEVMAPYFLYLLNPDDVSSLKFSVGNIHPGEVKQIVICVSNKKPDDVEDGSIDIARESKFNYDLEFMYTENLSVNYDIYELKKYKLNEDDEIKDDYIIVNGIDNAYWKKNSPLKITRDVTKERLNSVFGTETPEGVVNKGRYLLYQEDGQSKPLGLEYKDNTYEYDYYLIEISWKDGVKFTDYTKETDLIYVVVNAKQPKPKEQS